MLNFQKKKFQSRKKIVRFQNCGENNLGQQIEQGSKANIFNDIISSSSSTANTSPSATSTPPRYPRHQIFISNEEIKNRWYDRSDLMRFREQAIKLVFFQRDRGNKIVKSQPCGMGSLYMKRKRHKANAIRHIVLAHRIRKSEEYLARLCISLGRWSKEIALRNALFHYFEVYKPSFVEKIPPVLSNPPRISIISVHPAKTDSRPLSQTEESTC